MIRPERVRWKDTFNLHSIVKVRLPLRQLPTRLECGVETLEFESSPSTHNQRQQYKPEFREDPETDMELSTNDSFTCNHRKSRSARYPFLV